MPTDDIMKIFCVFNLTYSINWSPLQQTIDNLSISSEDYREGNTFTVCKMKCISY